MKISKKTLILSAALAAALLLAACATSTPTPEIKEVEVTREVTREVQVEVTRVVEVTPEGGVPFQEMWAASAHADQAAEAFTHWDEDSPPLVPTSCSRCHSTPGFLDYIGADGSKVGSVDLPAPTGTVVECVACHNPTTLAMTSVTFPSGAEITGLGPEARCMQCHQGQAWGGSVDDAIIKAGLKDDDTISPELGFTNIHYFAAAVARYGTQVKGGYEYAGQSYDVLFEHVPGVDRCTDCHNPHSLEVQVEKCAACHSGVAGVEDLKNVRMASSMVDYDGDGNLDEGVYYEIEGVRARLYQAIQAYAAEVSQKPIVYSPDAYPYFFVDLNADGQAGADETSFDNLYNAWTGRLAKAAYNYHLSVKDPGAFAHGGKYILELLYDSTANLNEKLSTPVDLSGMRRIDAGHFAGSEEAFRHWDEEGEVPATCARCHSGQGAATFVKNGVNIAAEPANGMLCANCHDSLATFSRQRVDAVTFPSGARVTFGEANDANLCILCHQGRESTASVNSAIRAIGLGDDEPSDKLRFRNIHYFAAGATLFGTEVKGVYEYSGREYLGMFEHGGIGPVECVQCHSTHGLQVRVSLCANCHKTVKTVEDIQTLRGPSSDADYDGDDDATEGIAGEIETLQAALYAAIQKYAAETAGAGLVYDEHAYPYFFADQNGDGQPDKNDQGASVGYTAFTPRLLKAAYNYQYAFKDPGKFAHNGRYIVQMLYDSLEDIGGDVSQMTRP